MSIFHRCAPLCNPDLGILGLDAVQFHEVNMADQGHINMKSR